MSVATNEEIDNLVNRPEVLLIDVRDPPEIKSTGSIPTAINIPLGTLEESLKLSEDEFKEHFGRDKPGNDTEVIFSCRLGGRAAKAAEVAKTLGLENSRVYQGSWAAWAEYKNLS